MKLYNTLSGKKELFVPIKKGRALMYTCGPTVHDYAHIGNFRTFLFQDLLKRWLLYKGYRVKHVMNITDVDEKTIERVKRKKVGLKDVTETYERAFFEDIDTLNIKRADVYPRASEHIDEMVELSRKLQKNGSAFQEEDGTIYFDVTASKDYGSLSKKRPKDRLRRKTKREDYDEPAHFALWKPRDEMDANIYWKTSLGEGRPGWHCECSTMALKYLGEAIDIHAGGADLVFPHHENGKAICEAMTGKEFSRYWLHSKHLMVDGQQMSKTLRNYFTLGDVLKKGYSPAAIRMVLLQTHYRKKLNFTFKKIEVAEKKIKKLESFVLVLEGAGSTKSSKTVESDLMKMRQDFEVALNDDLNPVPALRALFGFIDKYHDKKISKLDVKKILKTLKELDGVLGLTRDLK
jgi:cysteinyl-tRNA synthetase